MSILNQLGDRLVATKRQRAIIDNWTAFNDFDAGHTAGMLGQLDDEIEFLERLINENENDKEKVETDSREDNLKESSL